MKQNHSNRYLSVSVCLALLIVLINAGQGLAAGEAVVTVSETELKFTGMTGESLQRSFTLLVQGGPIENVEVSIQEPLNVDNDGHYISLDKLVVDPQSLPEVNGQQDFRLTMTGYDQPGAYTGKLSILYGSPPEQEKIEIALLFELNSAPNVEAAASSQNIVLPTDPGCWDNRFATPSGGADAPRIGETSLTLVQKAEGPATIEKADAVDFSTDASVKLPKDSVLVAADLPIELTQLGEQTDLPVEVHGRNLRAGEYSGTVQVIVKNQATLLEIPLKVQVKDGRLLPFLAMVFGFLAAVILPRYKNTGQAVISLQKNVDKIQKLLDEKSYLGSELHNTVTESLEDARKKVMQGDTSQELADQLDALRKEIEASQAEAKAFVSTEVKAREVELSAITVASGFRGDLSGRIDTLKDRVKRGDFKDLSTLRSEVKNLQQQIDCLKEVADAYPGLTKERKEEIKDELGSSTDLTRLCELVGLEESDTAASYGVRNVVSFEKLPWIGFKLKWQIVKVLAYIITISFTLGLGWFTIYEANPTFGAQSSDYTTLILWIAAVDFAGVATMDLKSIYTTVTTPQTL